MKRLVYTFDNVFGMSNMLGKFVKVGGPLNVSFYFGSKHAGGGEISHDIRVKVYPNREKFVDSDSFYLELHGDYAISESTFSARY